MSYIITDLELERENAIESKEKHIECIRNVIDDIEKKGFKEFAELLKEDLECLELEFDIFSFEVEEDFIEEEYKCPFAYFLMEVFSYKKIF